MRVASSSFGLKVLTSEKEFLSQLNKHVHFACDYGAGAIVFPEYFSAALLTIKNDWFYWTDFLKETLQSLAKKNNIVIVGGTHLTKEDSKTFVRSHIAFPDGKLLFQDKVHLTPQERKEWQLANGTELKIFEVNNIKAAVAICYDVEFPELVRQAAKKGCELLFCPSWTDDEYGFDRVRYCAHARTIENQMYVVHAPLTGGLTDIRYFEQAVGRAGVLCPCDVGFAKNGLLAEGKDNIDMTVVAECEIEKIRFIRKAGTVTPLSDS